MIYVTINDQVFGKHISFFSRRFSFCNNFFLTLGFYLSPETLIFFEPAGLSEDGRKFFGALFGFFLGVLIVVVFFGTLLVSLEMNKNIRKILQILESKNKTEIPISKNKTPPEF